MSEEMTLSRVREIEERAKAARKNLPLEAYGTFINHSREDIPSLTKALREAWKALGEISNRPEQSYEFWYRKTNSAADRQYQIGVTDGHRCCIKIARVALPDDWEE